MVFKMKANLHARERGIRLIFVLQIFYRVFCNAGYTASSRIFRVDQLFSIIIVNAENTTLHKCVGQINSRHIFRTSSEIVGVCALIPSQNSFNGYL